MHTTHRPAYWIVGAGLAIALVACGGSGNDSTRAGDTTAEADEMASPAEVRTGLAEVQAIIESLPALHAGDEAQARDQVTAMYDLWFEFESTIRADDKDLYLQMEDGLVAAKIGVQESRPDKIDEGVAVFTAAVDQYRARHP
jgi:hypothetical protein